MAQRVPYWRDNVTYEEGPFVMVYANGWRVEVELKDHHCPVLPDSSIYDLLREHGLNYTKTENPKSMETVVNWLNQKVSEGLIVLQNRQWVCPTADVRNSQ